jgi:hypothetical protein
MALKTINTPTWQNVKYYVKQFGVNVVYYFGQIWIFAYLKQILKKTTLKKNQMKTVHNR